jgi:hypothetical protein
MGGVDDQPSSRAQRRTGQNEDKARLAHPEEKKVLREMENGVGVSGTTPGKADEKAEGGSVVGVENAGLRRSFEWPEDVFWFHWMRVMTLWTISNEGGMGGDGEVGNGVV